MAIALFLSYPSFALAQSCHNQQGPTICLEQVRRSAKYYWQYRVVATINGKTQPETQYNCRDRTRTVISGPQKGQTLEFAPQGVGDLVCQLVHH